MLVPIQSPTLSSVALNPKAQTHETSKASSYQVRSRQGEMRLFIAEPCGLPSMWPGLLRFLGLTKMVQSIHVVF